MPRPPPVMDHVIVDHYEVKLVQFEYDSSIDLLVRKLNIRRVEVEKPFICGKEEFIEWEQGNNATSTLKLGIDSFGEQDGHKFVQFTLFDSNPPSSGIKGKLFENGSPISSGTWVGKKGIGFSGFLICLVKFSPLELEICRME
jgi:hypothetical protein